MAQAKEFIFFLSPDFNTLPKVVFTKLWEASKRGVRVMLISGETNLSDQQELASLQNSRVTFHFNQRLNTSVYLNEKEAVFTSFSRFAPSEQNATEFGVFFRKKYAAQLYDELLKESREILGQSTKMVIEDSGFISAEELWERRQKLQEAKSPEEISLTNSAKPLTIKEKQELILKLFAREYKDCTIKVEDAERLRVYGRGIVLALSKERVDMIFVHYEAYQSRMEEVKQFLAERNPEMKVWFQYNRINMKLERETEIASAFTVVNEMVLRYKLVTLQ